MTTQKPPTLTVQLAIYKRLLSYLLPYWKYLILILLGFVINAITEVSIAKLMQFIIDAINNKNQQHKNWFPIIIIALFIVRGTGSFIGNYFTAFVSRNLIHTLRTEVFSHILHSPSRFFQQYSSGHLSAKIIFNIEQVTGAATEALRTLFRDGLIVIVLPSFS